MATGDPYYYPYYYYPYYNYHYPICSRCGKFLGAEIVYWINGQCVCSSCYGNYVYTKLCVTVTNGAWVCPKCGRVWSNQIWSCVNCNNAITEQAKSKKDCRGSMLKSDDCTGCKHGTDLFNCPQKCSRWKIPAVPCERQDCWTEDPASKIKAGG